MSVEEMNQLRKRINLALETSSFVSGVLPRIEEAVVARVIDRIVGDDRLRALFSRLDDGEALCRTFLSLYFQARYMRPLKRPPSSERMFRVRRRGCGYAFESPALFLWRDQLSEVLEDAQAHLAAEN